jgi:hypothetical protein
LWGRRGAVCHSGVPQGYSFLHRAGMDIECETYVRLESVWVSKCEGFCWTTFRCS